MDSPRQNPRDLKDHKPPPSPSASPNSSSTSSTSSTTNGPPTAPPPPPPSSSSLPPLTPRSNPNPTPATPNPYPTTFIQADTQSFKQVVQMLTGSAETTAKRSTQAQTNPQNSNFAPAQPQKSQIPPINRPTKKPAFKLYERRSSMKNLKMISPLIPSFPNRPSPAAFSPRQHQHHHHHQRQPEILSPSILDFPKLVLSPVTPLSPDPFSPEDRAIAEKGFYLHPSPRATTPRDAEPPKLLPLFPLTSPRMESSAAAAAAAESSA